MGSYDYINYKLTNKYSIEHNWALESGLMDFKKKKFTKKLANFGSINIKNLSTINKSDTIIGNISKNIAVVIPAHNIPAFKPSKTFVNSVKQNVPIV